MSATQEIKVWGDGDKGLWSFGDTIDIPAGFVEVPTGNHFLTRTIKKLAERVYVRMEKNKGGFSRAIGIIAEKSIVEEARVLAEQTEETRKVRRQSAAKYRAKREEKHQAEVRSRILQLYPGMPANEATIVVDRAFEVGSGRIGRASSVDLEMKLELAVKAHIRHQHTGYDELLMQGWEREDAREDIRFEVESVHDLWRADGTVSEDVEDGFACCRTEEQGGVKCP